MKTVAITSEKKVKKNLKAKNGKKLKKINKFLKQIDKQIAQLHSVAATLQIFREEVLKAA